MQKLAIRVTIFLAGLFMVWLFYGCLRVDFEKTGDVWEQTTVRGLLFAAMMAGQTMVTIALFGFGGDDAGE